MESKDNPSANSDNRARLPGVFVHHPAFSQLTAGIADVFDQAHLDLACRSMLRLS